MAEAESGSSGCWVGPFRLRDYLERSIDTVQEWPPEAAGVYVVSVNPWAGEPTSDSRILYVGGNPNAPIQFRNRVGFLVKDMLGFWGDIAWGSHSGGQSIWKWCFGNRVHPLDLYLGWVTGIECGRCTETDLYARFQPLLNRKAPARCLGHEFVDAQVAEPATAADRGSLTGLRLQAHSAPRRFQAESFGGGDEA